MTPDRLHEIIRDRTSLSYSRSGGPGGQNVNKRDTKVTAKFPISLLNSIDPDAADRAKRRLAGRLNTDGELVLQADGERSQARNREIVLERLERLLREALKPDPKPRRASKPSRAARERRLAAKKRRSQVKAGRGSVRLNDD